MAISEAENKFIDSIDCNFPYQDSRECLRLIDEAATLSSNAMFFVIHEICRIPYSKKESIATDFLLDLLSQIRTKFSHPLKEIILEVAAKMVQGQELTADEAILKMEILKKHTGQYAALSILYFSCNDEESRLESVWDNIIRYWENSDL